MNRRATDKRTAVSAALVEGTSINATCRMTGVAKQTTDGHRVYAEAVEDAFSADIDYASLVKIYGASNDNPLQPRNLRWGPHWSSRRESRSRPYLNLVRGAQQSFDAEGMRRFTRLTNALSKTLENHGHMVALHFMHYNFCRLHKTIRVTPAMEAGLTDHVWALDELVALL